MKTVERKAFIPKMPVQKNVAAYARVSTKKDAMHHSLSAQISYYSEYIQIHPGWRYCGVYADEAMTGTKASRADFQRMLTDARDGRLDLILCKSISRFARNTVTLLDTVRELKDLGVDVYFEEQNLHTISSEGELMLTILAGFAEEESLSVSENMKWRVRMNFGEGIPWDKTLLGYRFRDGAYVIEENEAKVVRRMFRDYLDGKGTGTIAKELNEEGIPTRFGNEWSNSTVMRLLKNITYTGDLVLQKTYSENHLTKRKMPNNGQFPKYVVEDAHEPIIDKSTFLAVQKEFERRQTEYGKTEIRPTYPLTGKVRCGICGKNYQRKYRSKGISWLCDTYIHKGVSFCPSRQVPEDILLKLAEKYGGIERIDTITAYPGNELIFQLKDGTAHTEIWKFPSRAESWTPEMRQRARERSIAHA